MAVVAAPDKGAAVLLPAVTADTVWDLTGTSRIARTKNRCAHAAILMLLPAVTAVSAALLSGA